MSLKPGSRVEESYPELSMGKGLGSSLDTRRSQSRPGLLQLSYIQDQLGIKSDKEDSSHTESEDNRSWTLVSNGQDPALCSPPKTENEVGFASKGSHPIHFYPIVFAHWYLVLLCKLFFLCACVCSLFSCVWSSTSSRRKSGGWGSSSTRGMYASNSWNWRLRTSETPSLRARFDTAAAPFGPPYRVTFTSS